VRTERPAIILPEWIVDACGIGDYWADMGDDAGANVNVNQNQPPIPPMLPPVPAALQPTPQVQMAIAQAAMDQVRAVVQARLETSVEWQVANAAVTHALADIDAATAQAKQDLSKNQQYTDLVDRRQKIQDQIAHIQYTVKDPTPAMLTPLATANLDLGSQIKTMEADLLAKNPAVADAQQRLWTAQAKVESLKKSVDADVLADPTWQAARQQLEAARVRIASGN
jgi:chromosome segregation ATPase